MISYTVYMNQKRGIHEEMVANFYFSEIYINCGRDIIYKGGNR